MNSKNSASVSVCFFAIIVAVFTGGCATNNRFVPGYGHLPKGAPTYALAVAVHGGVEPTAAQWNAMYTRFSQALAARGMLLINDYTRAEHIIHLDFLPDPTSPTRGTAMITSIVANPAFGQTAAIARTSYATSFASSRSTSYDPYWPSTYGYDRYNYSGNYYDYANSSYGYVTPTPSPTPTPPSPVAPPSNHRPPNPADCPPGAPPYRPPPSFVGHHPPPPSHAYRPLPASDHTSGSSRVSSSSGSSSDSSSRSSYSSSSDSSSSYSSGSSSSSSSSYSAPSYSPPAESSSYSSSANSGGSDTGSRSVPR
jgi:uncharacterized membrane protein YgcG